MIRWGPAGLFASASAGPPGGGSAGDGGDQWEQAEPITFWWQSTVAPAGPAQAYAIDANYTQATGSGPYPGTANDSTNACVAPKLADAEG